MRKTKTVILYGQEGVLARSVEIFVSAKKDWEVIRITDQQSAKELIDVVEKVDPDVVVLCQSEDTDSEDLPWQLMQVHSRLKVITIGLEDNSMGIYDKKNVLVREVPDLLTVIGG